MDERRNGMQELHDDVKTILHILNGNGKVGLVAKVDVLWGVGIFLSITVVGIVVKLLAS